MKKSVIISAVLHLALLGAIVVITGSSNPWRRDIDVYQVELVQLPPKVEKVSMNETKPNPAPEPETAAPKPEPDPAEPATAKPVSKKEAPKKEPKKDPQQQAQKPPVKEPSKDASAATGSAQQVNVDTRDFPFSYYLNLLRYRVRENWRPPYQNSAEPVKISAVVGFSVQRNGKINGATIENSSDNYLFDQAAIRAVNTAGPLPPLPDEYAKEELTVHIEFEAVW